MIGENTRKTAQYSVMTSGGKKSGLSKKTFVMQYLRLMF